MSEKLWYHPEEICELLNISRPTFTRWIKAKTNIWKYTNFIGRTRVISRENLQRYLNGMKPAKEES